MINSLTCVEIKNYRMAYLGNLGYFQQEQQFVYIKISWKCWFQFGLLDTVSASIFKDWILENFNQRAMWNFQMFNVFFKNKWLWIFKMKFSTPFILLFSSFTFATRQNDGPCEYGCWGGEIDKDCERGCIAWCVEQARDSRTAIIDW